MNPDDLVFRVKDIASSNVQKKAGSHVCVHKDHLSEVYTAADQLIKIINQHRLELQILNNLIYANGLACVPGQEKNCAEYKALSGRKICPKPLCKKSLPSRL